MDLKGAMFEKAIHAPLWDISLVGSSGSKVNESVTSGIDAQIDGATKMRISPRLGLER